MTFSAAGPAETLGLTCPAMWYIVLTCAGRYTGNRSVVCLLKSVSAKHDGQVRGRSTRWCRGAVADSATWFRPQSQCHVRPTVVDQRPAGRRRHDSTAWSIHVRRRTQATDRLRTVGVRWTWTDGRQTGKTNYQHCQYDQHRIQRWLQIRFSILL